MAQKKQAAAKKEKRAQKKEPEPVVASVIVYKHGDGEYRMRALDEAGNAIKDLRGTYNNRMYARKVALQRYPGVEVVFGA